MLYAVGFSKNQHSSKQRRWIYVLIRSEISLEQRALTIWYTIQILSFRFFSKCFNRRAQTRNLHFNALHVSLNFINLYSTYLQGYNISKNIEINAEISQEKSQFQYRFYWRWTFIQVVDWFREKVFNHRDENSIDWSTSNNCNLLKVTNWMFGQKPDQP